MFLFVHVNIWSDKQEDYLFLDKTRVTFYVMMLIETWHTNESDYVILYDNHSFY